MHPITRTARQLAAASAGALALGAAAAPHAGAQEGHSLALDGPPSADVGQAITLQATGVVPPDVFLQRYLNAYVVPTSVVQSCPPSYQGALQIKDNSGAQGGETIALAVPADGSFTIPVAWTPQTAGAFLVCGYLVEGPETMATATHAITIRAASGGGGGGGGGTGGGGDGATAAPASTAKPTLRRTGRKLRCGRGEWSGAPTGFTYRWTVDGQRRKGTRRALRITRAMDGARVRCTVIASNAAGDASATSRAVRVSLG